MRRLLLAIALCTLAAGCGGGTSEPSAPDSVQALLDRPGPDVALIAGTSDYEPREIRYSFLVVANDGKTVNRPRARVSIARSREEPPVVTTTATLEFVGVRGVSETPIGDADHVYVARFRVPGPGKYFVVAEPVGSAIQGYQNLVVPTKPAAPSVGARAIPSRTPTIASANGDLASLTTSTPPDVALLRTSIAEAMAARVPFVVTFATPKYCASRTCGPAVDVVEAARKRFAGTPIRFLHVEIYQDNDPSKGPNRWVKEWRLPSEPWVFLVGRDGLIKARFEGALSVGELTAAVQRFLA